MGLDPLGDLIVEVRQIPAVAAIVGSRVRGREPQGATASYVGDAQGPGKYKAFIVLVALSRPPDRRVPITFAEYAVRCYGRTSAEADQLFDAVSGGMARRGHRLHTSGLGVYRSDVTGGSHETDPKTQQPMTVGTIQLIATTQAVAQ